MKSVEHKYNSTHGFLQTTLEQLGLGRRKKKSFIEYVLYDTIRILYFASKKIHISKHHIKKTCHVIISVFLNAHFFSYSNQDQKNCGEGGLVFIPVKFRAVLFCGMPW